jgi:DNA-binding CsgD family transcriptional regulator
MWSNTATRFNDTRQRERELNDRQRKVLDLIEKGHTNREIADMLGMTVDGAKWNVSEILGKLALDSREDAAEYWRWRQRRAPAVVRAMRALFGLPAAKWVAGGTAAAAVGTTVAAVLLMGSGSGASQQPDPLQFYLEATIHRADPEYPTDHVLRWWQLDADHARWDYDQLTPAIRSTHTTTIIDGSEQFKFSRDGSDVGRGPLEPTGNPLGLPSDLIFVGPVRQSNLGEVLADLSSWGDEAVTAEVVGYEDVGGTQATVIEWASGTIWLDTSEMVVLRNHLDSMRAEVTRLERRPVSEDEVRPPAEIVARPTSTPIPVRRGLPAGLSSDTNMLRPTYLPGEIRDQMGGSNGCRPFDCYYELMAMSEAQMQANQALPGTPLRNGEYIWIEQRTGLREMPSALMSGTPVAVRGVTGYLDESGTNPVLSWQEPDGRIVRIEGSLVPAAELLKVADGLAKPGP